MNLGVICDVIILVAAVLVAITNIYKFFANSGKGIKKRIDENQEEAKQKFDTDVRNVIIAVKQENAEEEIKQREEQFKEYLNRVMPELFLEHDKETRKTYLSDRLKYLNEIKEEVVFDMQNELKSVEEHDLQMKTFTEVLKELLRERIMEIYRRNKAIRQLEEHESIELNQAYSSYKSIKGNSYIDGYYEQMTKWEVVPDDRE